MIKKGSIFFLLAFMAFVLNYGNILAENDLTLGDTAPSIGDSSVDPIDNLEGVTILDNFNRADGPIGANWTDRAGTFNVVSYAAQGGATALATYNGVASTILEADVQVNGTQLQYTGLVLAYADIDNNYFIKVQQQSGGGEFSHYALYYGNNTSGQFASLSENFSTAHMKVELSGTTVTLTFSNIDGGSKVDQTYSYDYGTGTGGTAIGICGYANLARLDNFTNGEMECDYCIKDVAFTPKLCININNDGVVTGQAILAGSSSFPAALTGRYYSSASTLVFAIDYYDNTGLRFYQLNTSNFTALTWGVSSGTGEFYDNPHSTTFVSCEFLGELENQAVETGAAPE